MITYDRLLGFNQSYRLIKALIDYKNNNNLSKEDKKAYNDELNNFLNDIVLIAMNMSLLAKLAHFKGEIPNSLVPTPLIIWGGKKHSKKEILGKTKSIHKIPGDRKEYVKHKGKLITVKSYKELMKKKK